MIKLVYIAKNKFNRKMLASKRLESIKDFKIRKFCSHKCYSNFNVLENHYLHKVEGGITNEGYRRVRIEDRKERIREHCMVMEKSLGRKLLKHEHVHHKN